jgi:hypothetical protein
LLEFTEEVLDQVARFVEVFIIVALDDSVCFWRDHNGDSLGGQLVDDALLGIVGRVDELQQVSF